MDMKFLIIGNRKGFLLQFIHCKKKIDMLDFVISFPLVNFQNSGAL